MFEPLVVIADYLFANKLEGAFRLPRLTAQELRLQGLKQTYTY